MGRRCQRQFAIDEAAIETESIVVARGGWWRVVAGCGSICIGELNRGEGFQTIVQPDRGWARSRGWARNRSWREDGQWLLLADSLSVSIGVFSVVTSNGFVLNWDRLRVWQADSEVDFWQHVSKMPPWMRKNCNIANVQLDATQRERVGFSRLKRGLSDLGRRLALASLQWGAEKTPHAEENHGQIQKEC